MFQLSTARLISTLLVATPSAAPSGFSWNCVLGVVVFITACAAPLTDDECVQLLDHYTAKLVLDEHPDASRIFIAEKQAAAREVARRDPRYEFDACASRVRRSQFECAMRAPNVDAIEQCLTL